jgi:hypothetical protein
LKAPIKGLATVESEGGSPAWRAFFNAEARISAKGLVYNTFPQAAFSSPPLKREFRLSDWFITCFVKPLFQVQSMTDRQADLGIGLRKRLEKAACRATCFCHQKQMVA